MKYDVWEIKGAMCKNLPPVEFKTNRGSLSLEYPLSVAN